MFLPFVSLLYKTRSKILSKQFSVIALRTKGDFVEVLPNIYRTNHHIWFVGLWMYIKTPIKPHLHHLKKVLRLNHFKPQFHASRELFFQNGFLKVFELYAMELLEFRLQSVRGENCSYFVTASIKHALMFMKRGV